MHQEVCPHSPLCPHHVLISALSPTLYVSRCYTTDSGTRWDYCEVNCAEEPVSPTEDPSSCTTTTLQLAALKENPMFTDPGRKSHALWP